MLLFFISDGFTGSEAVTNEPSLTKLFFMAIVMKKNYNKINPGIRAL